MAYSAQTFTAFEQPTLAKWNALWANDADFQTRIGTARGFNSNAGATLTTSYADFATVTATTLGGQVIVECGGIISNANSGAGRTYDLKILADGTDITPSPLVGQYLGNFSTSTPTPFSFVVAHTPTAASHTWKIQLEASAGASVILTRNYIHVTECG